MNTAQPSISVRKLARKKFKLLDFEGEWKDLIGLPECAGSWIIYGESGNGKTTFALKLLRYFTNFKTCAYIPLEEGTKLTFQEAINNANLLPVSSKIKIWEGYTLHDLDVELPKPRAPKVVFIDSVQYLRKNKKAMNQLTNFEYLDLLRKYPDVLFIFISHAKNDEPKGAVADAIYYGSDVCIHIKDFVAIPKKSRYKGNTKMKFS